MATAAGIVGAGTAGHVVHALGGATMGTRWQVTACAPRDADLRALHDGIQACLDRVVAEMSTWEQGSDISRYNRAPAGTWQVLPAAFFEVLSRALRIADESGGACDPTVGPLVRAWGFGPGGRGGQIPEAAALDAARRNVGWRRLGLDAATRRVLQPGGVELDLSGVAKGHAVDAVSDWLRTQGVSGSLVDVGGELRGHGRKPDGSAWQVLVEDDEEDEAEDATGAAKPCILCLYGAAVATSGERWHRFEQDGRRYAHTIDPRSGRPVEHAPALVTVVAPSALDADAWATALTVLGVEAGLALADARGMAARFVAGDGARRTVRESRAFAGYVAGEAGRT